MPRFCWSCSCGANIVTRKPCRIARGLIQSYPHDVLMALEEGNLLRAEGHDREAGACIEKSGRRDAKVFMTACTMRSPHSVWAICFAARRTTRMPSLRMNRSMRFAQPDPEVLQKANLAAGEMYDVLEKRDLAVKKYHAVVATDAATPFADSANRYLKEAYRGE